MSMQVELCVKRPGHPERRVTLVAGTTNMGRAENNDLVLPDIGVSRRHARILIDDSSVTIEDLGSGNGTYFRGQRIHSQPLDDGDEVLIDPYILAFSLAESARAPSPDAADTLEEDTARLSELPVENTTGAAVGARLVTMSGQRLEPAYPIRGQGLTMGRSEGREIVIFDPAASRMHCEVRLTNEGYLLRDFGSANGTFVNTRRTRERLLEHGDRIRIGATELQFELLAPPPRSHTAPMPNKAGAQAQAPARRRPQKRRRKENPIWMLVRVAAAFFVLMFLVGGVIGLALVVKYLPAHLAASKATPLELPAPVEDTEFVQALMASGMDHFEHGRYLDAAAQFYRVQQVVPTHPTAERMGYVACEYIAIGELQTDMFVRTSTEAEKKEIYKDALSQGDLALEGKADLADARTSLELGLELFPGDKKLAASLKKVRRALKQEADKEAEEHEAKVKALYEAAEKSLDAKAWTEASSGFQAVLDADPEKDTPYYEQAEAGLKRAREGGGS